MSQKAVHSHGRGPNKLSPAQIFYQLVLSFLAEDSLEQATLKADALRKADCDDALPYRTPRRSRSAHYGVVRHALNYMLFVHGVSHTARRRISPQRASAGSGKLRPLSGNFVWLPNGRSAVRHFAQRSGASKGES